MSDISGNLSGGEKQHIFIARALLKDIPIIVFNELLSALDTESKTAISEVAMSG